MLKRVVWYVFPIYLTVAEYAMRFALGESASHFSLSASTSSVSAGGLSLIAATLIPKSVALDAAVQQALRTANVLNLGADDARLIVCAVIALLGLPLAWGWALYMDHNNIETYDVILGPIRLPGRFLAAIAIYVLGIIFSEAKERI